jgi:phosphoribosyl 1,2-cyclic phosphate phosphodiesterase
MKIQYLGTAAAEGWPAVFCQCVPCMRAKEAGGKNVRTRSSILINDTSLVDFPPDTYLHVLRDGLDLGEIEHIFITHSHADHLYLNDLARRSKPYAHLKKETKLMLWANQVVTGMLDKRSSAFNTIQNNTVKPGDTFQAGELIVTALRADHMRDEEALLFIICDEEKGIFYAHDSGWYPEEAWHYLEGKELDLVNFDCTFGPISNRHGHMGIPEILEAREKLWDIGAIKHEAKCVITHFSHNGGLLHQELVEHVAGTGLIVAYDGMVIEI